MVDPNFTFYGVRKPLQQGQHMATITSFDTKEKISSKGNKYLTLAARVKIEGETHFLNLSLDPNEEGKATNKLIKQLAAKEGKTETELIELCSVPSEFFTFAIGKQIVVEVNEQGYLDVSSELEPKKEKLDENVNPNDIPF